MKKYIFLLLGIIGSSVMLVACDLCSIYMNLEPNDLKNSFGFNYRYRAFEHKATNYSISSTNNKHAIGNTITSETQTQREVFNSYDLWINYFFNSKWQLFANLSLTDNSYFEDDSLLHNIAGAGDLSLIAKHILYNTKSTDSAKKVFRFVVGGGVKLPTGNFNKKYTVTPSTSYKGNTVYGAPYQELDPHLQGGTGSLDFILLSEFLVRLQSFGFSTDVSYRINTNNSNDFRFANRLNSNSSFFYQIKLKKNVLMPVIGLSFEYSERDQLEHKDYLNSGGNSLFVSYGAKFYLKSFAVGAAYFDPIRQSLNDNQLQNKKRVTTHLTYYF